MRKKLILITIFVPFLFCGCRTMNPTLDDYIVTLKRSLLKAKERTIFEEYVKFYELGKYMVSLYEISDVKFEANTKLSKQRILMGLS